MLVALAFLVVVLVVPFAALAQSGAQITISQPAEATTMIRAAAARSSPSTTSSTSTTR